MQPAVTSATAPPAFSLTRGGPIYRVMTRLGLRSSRSFVLLGFLVWAPLAIGEATRATFAMPLDPTLFDLSVHARLLLSLPMLLIGERLLDETVVSAMTSMYRGEFCDRASLDRICARAERLRDSGHVELALLGIAIAGGQLALWQVLGTSGLVHGGMHAGFWSFPRVWYSVVGLPLYQLVMFRWLWRWLIWCYMLAKIARLPLSLLATHADGASGLAGLSRPSVGFGAFVLAIGVTLSSAWATQILALHTRLESLLPLMVTDLVLSLVIAVGPLLMFTGHLFRSRRKTLARYGDFMRRYVLDFHAKWIEAPQVESSLGTSDIQSLADIGNSYSVAAKSRITVFGARQVIAVWFAGFLPMIPLFASTVTFEQVLARIVKTVLGGLPF